MPHSDSCICPTCLERQAKVRSRGDELKSSSHLRFKSPPRGMDPYSERPKCRFCKLRRIGVSQDGALHRRLILNQSCERCDKKAVKAKLAGQDPSEVGDIAEPVPANSPPSNPSTSKCESCQTNPVWKNKTIQLPNCRDCHMSMLTEKNNRPGKERRRRKLEASWSTQNPVGPAASAPKCKLCKTDMALFSQTAYCRSCHLKMIADKTKEGKERRRLEKLQEVQVGPSAASKFIMIAERLEKFRSGLSKIPFKPVDIRYAVDHFCKKLGNRVDQLFPGYGKLTSRSKRRKHRSFLCKHFTEVLSIQEIDGEWMCCQNRFDLVDLGKYWILKSSKEIDEVRVEDEEPGPSTDGPVTSSKKRKRGARESKRKAKGPPESDPAEEIQEIVEPEPEPERKTVEIVYIVDSSDTDSNVEEFAFQDPVSPPDEDEVELEIEDTTKADLGTLEDPDIDIEPEAATDGSLDPRRPSEQTEDISSPEDEVSVLSPAKSEQERESHSDTSDVESLLAPSKKRSKSSGNVLLDDSDQENLTSLAAGRKRIIPKIEILSDDEDDEPVPVRQPKRKLKKVRKSDKSKKRHQPEEDPVPKKRRKSSQKKAKKVKVVDQSGSDLESDYVPSSDSESSTTSISSPSSSDSESEFEGSRAASESDSSTSASDSDRRVFQPVVVLETVAEKAQKIQEGRERSREWERIATKREDYEERTLGHIQFERVTLDYAVGVISQRLGWDRFPFGAKVLNKGVISRKQLLDPNGGEWGALKEEFVRKHFKTALSITPFRGGWLCCKNRTDALDIPIYLREYWNIGLK